MNKIRLAIGSTDNIEIDNSHLGDIENFCIYDVFEDLTTQYIESRKNTVRHHQHGAGSKMKEILKILSDTNILLARQKSPNFVNIAKKTRYQPIVIKQEKIADVLDPYC